MKIALVVYCHIKEIHFLILLSNTEHSARCSRSSSSSFMLERTCSSLSPAASFQASNAGTLVHQHSEPLVGAYIAGQDATLFP